MNINNAKEYLKLQ